MVGVGMIRSNVDICAGTFTKCCTKLVKVGPESTTAKLRSSDSVNFSVNSTEASTSAQIGITCLPLHACLYSGTLASVIQTSCVYVCTTWHIPHLCHTRPSYGRPAGSALWCTRSWRRLAHRCHHGTRAKQPVFLPQACRRQACADCMKRCQTLYRPESQGIRRVAWLARAACTMGVE